MNVVVVHVVVKCGATKVSIKHADPGQISTVNRLFNSVEMRYLSVKILLLKCKLIITTVHRFLIITMTSKRKSFNYVCDRCTFHHKSSLNIAWFVRGKSVSSRIHRDLESLPFYERQFPCFSRCNNNNTTWPRILNRTRTKSVKGEYSPPSLHLIDWWTLRKMEGMLSLSILRSSIPLW